MEVVNSMSIGAHPVGTMANSSPANKVDFRTRGSHGAVLLPLYVTAYRGIKIKINDSASLLLACRRRSLKMMRTLLVAGADPDAVNEDITTSLHYAALHGFTEGVDLLLQFECSPDIENNFYPTSLIYVASRNYFDIVRHIIAHDASTLYLETEEHNTALLIALKQVLLLRAIVCQIHLSCIHRVIAKRPPGTTQGDVMRVAALSTFPLLSQLFVSASFFHPHSYYNLKIGDQYY
nr:hypothetical transcript [Hymenolepis microstoma]